MMLFTSTQNRSPFILATSQDELDTTRYGSDRWLLGSVILLMVVGILAVYSSIAFFAETKGTTAGSLMFGHMVKMGIALSVMLIMSKIPYKVMLKFSKAILILSWIFLIVVSLYGTQTFGAKRSLTLGGFSFQPSAIASTALLLYLVVLLDNKKEYIKDFSRAFVPILFWVGITCALIGLEDFSSAGVLFAISLTLMFVGRVNLSHIMGLILIGVLGSWILVSSSQERVSRVSDYVDQIVHIRSDEFSIDNGYQAQQSQIAIARGEIFGVGIGKSSQRDFLPAPYNDFIYAIISEEYGLFGATLVLGVYVFIFMRGMVFIARKSNDYRGQLLAVAATLGITIYAFVNAGVAVGLLPVTGLPMPFISYGGTSMITAGALAGILLNISRRRRAKKTEDGNDE
jgi:cell division protein FtsW